MTIPDATMADVIATLQAIAAQEPEPEPDDMTSATAYSRGLGRCRGKADSALFALRLAGVAAPAKAGT